MTVFRVPGPPVPVPSPPVHRPDLDAIPAPAVVAGVLGLLAAVLAALAGSFVVLLVATSEPLFAVTPFALATAALAGSQLAGAILLLCRRSGRLLVVSAVPLAALAALLVLRDVSVSLAAVPVGSGACAAAAAALALTAPVRRWTAARPRRVAPLREEVRWL